MENDTMSYLLNDQKVKMVSEILEKRYDNDDSFRENVIYLLKDLRHFCKSKGIDFNDCINVSEFYFIADCS
jgi:hypothetical protein